MGFAMPVEASGHIAVNEDSQRGETSRRLSSDGTSENFELVVL